MKTLTNIILQFVLLSGVTQAQAGDASERGKANCHQAIELGRDVEKCYFPVECSWPSTEVEWSCLTEIGVLERVTPEACKAAATNFVQQWCPSRN